MTDETETLRRENQYLKQRLAQLQEDLTNVSSEAERLRQRLEHASAKRAQTRPDPLSGGQ